jgi:hypothetical protein
MGTNEVMLKTLALAQAQLSNYKVTDAYRAISSTTPAYSEKSTNRSPNNKTGSTVNKNR